MKLFIWKEGSEYHCVAADSLREAQDMLAEKQPSMEYAGPPDEEHDFPMYFILKGVIQ